MEKLYKITLGAAPCALDIGDGSERGEYVNQDYMLNVLGRPHRCVNLMYTYYPKDKEWDGKSKISQICKDMEIHYQWDYPYDDYFPYGGGIGGSTEGEPFVFMKDIRRHGQDVSLTLTVDCSLEDEYLRQIARELKPYGRMKLRINHECAGTWFTHNKRFSYAEVGAFFVRFARIVKEEAPQIQTIFCSGFMDTEKELDKYAEAFREAFKIADMWSVDAYLALNFGWPFSIAEKGGEGFSVGNAEVNFQRYKKTFQNLTELCGEEKPMITAELNADGDVTGAAAQAESLLRFYGRIKEEKADWFKSVSFYQFRDRGRLGLETEDPNNSSVGIKQPVMEEYKKIIADDYFSPEIKTAGETQLPCKMRWGGAEDSEGLGIRLVFKKNPVFCEITFEDRLCLMLELNGRWFYKSAKVKTVDLMTAFHERPLEGETELCLKIFSTPPEGINPDTGAKDWDINYYSVLTQMPELRIRYESVENVG
ncbi:MAG: hypothetical protein NC203_12120 [Firmicutes bacterium]|nr:hypothetical protein [[Eubacterium] siraeum]MCM1489100.1 hypothetical protein [Bacillota bacterium]